MASKTVISYIVTFLYLAVEKSVSFSDSTMPKGVTDVGKINAG